MIIYLVRHGQTDWNKDEIVQGRIDNPLNDIGREQAKKVSEYFKGINPKYLISSSLDRAIETIGIIKEENSWDHDVYLDDSFIERDFGELEGKHAKYYREVENFDDVNSCERNEDLEQRINRGIDSLLEGLNVGEEVIIGCHSHVLKGFLCANFPDKYDYKYSLPNCAIIKAEYKDQQLSDIEIIKGE